MRRKMLKPPGSAAGEVRPIGGRKNVTKASQKTRGTLPKPSFAGAPMRAMGDRALTALDHRTLNVIAHVDRFSLQRDGPGCCIGLKKIAGAVGSARTKVSEAITRLVDLGYLEKERHPEDGRRMVLRVLYVQADHELAARLFGGDQETVAHAGDKMVHSTGNRIVHPTVNHSVKAVHQTGGIVHQRGELVHLAKSQPIVNNKETFPKEQKNRRSAHAHAHEGARALERTVDELSDREWLETTEHRVALAGWYGERQLQTLLGFKAKITDITARLSGEDLALAEKVARDVARRIAQNDCEA